MTKKVRQPSPDDTLPIWVLLYRDEGQKTALDPLMYSCWAETQAEAEELCEIENPGCSIVWAARIDSPAPEELKCGGTHRAAEESTGPQMPQAAIQALAFRSFTVFVQQSNGRGTIHIQTYRAETPEAASKAAIKEVMAVWGEDDPDAMHVLGIVKGDIDVIEWNDLDG